MEHLKVGIIFGGMSSEKEVSLNSGRNVYDHLDSEIFQGVPLFMDTEGNLWNIPWQLISQNTTTDISEHLNRKGRRIYYEDLKKEIDFAFITLHGKYGDDGCIQGFLELQKIPYTGPGVLASSLGMDKYMQQKILNHAGIHVPESMAIYEEVWQHNQIDIEQQVSDRFIPPFVIKPTREGSSVGITIIKDMAFFKQGVTEAFLWDRVVLVEEYLKGIEFSAIVYEDNRGEIHTLGVTEIHPQSSYYTYDDKYMPGRCRKFTPPKNIQPSIVDVIKQEVIRTFVTLGFRSYGRIDGFVLQDGRILITDPNSSSGMAPSSFFFEQAACAGMLPSTIISLLIKNALSIHRKKTGPI